ncbi:MAG TPA: hypothetical protein VNO70_10045 [Blastocatellia bacterium]|nr:hypothetical protein [Blastocatellia bacterium]
MRILASQLYEVSATDPVIFIAMSMLLIGGALAASYVPALRYE